jgi:hypothetical protein
MSSRLGTLKTLASRLADWNGMITPSPALMVTPPISMSSAAIGPAGAALSHAGP